MKKLFFALSLVFISTAAFAYPVAYNTNSKIYHGTTCPSARACTKNCINIDHTDAKQRGGRPCQKCGGRH